MCHDPQDTTYRRPRQGVLPTDVPARGRYLPPSPPGGATYRRPCQGAVRGGGRTALRSSDCRVSAGRRTSARGLRPGVLEQRRAHRVIQPSGHPRPGSAGNSHRSWVLLQGARRDGNITEFPHTRSVSSSHGEPATGRGLGWLHGARASPTPRAALRAPAPRPPGATGVPRLSHGVAADVPSDSHGPRILQRDTPKVVEATFLIA